MRKFQWIFLIVFLGLFSLEAFSQSPKKSSHLRKYALQFSIVKSKKAFSFSNFQGNILSGKVHFSDRCAVRVGIGAQYSSRRTDETTRSNSQSVSKSHRSTRHINFLINSQIIYYLYARNSIKLYTGIGPSFTMDDNKYFPSPSDAENKSLIYSIGLRPALGIEWFFYKYTSFSLEYAPGIFYYYHKDNLKGPTRDEYFKLSRAYHTLQFFPYGIHFGLSVYL